MNVHEFNYPQFREGCHVKATDLKGPQILDLNTSNMGGDVVYRVFGEVVTEWHNAPMLYGEVCEQYDPSPDVLDNLQPGFVLQVVVDIMAASRVSEAERKNSSSRSTSDSKSTSPRETNDETPSIAADANADEVYDPLPSEQ